MSSSVNRLWSLTVIVAGSLEELKDPTTENSITDESVVEQHGNFFVRDGKCFVIASELAREIGYATDHVTRLVRQNKIEGILENKKWYATRDSLENYLKVAKENKKNAGLKAVGKYKFEDD